MLLRDLAVARSGDKGDTVNIALIAHDSQAYHHIATHVTAPTVAHFFGPWVTGPVTRHDLPTLHAFNFVLRGALGGGVARTLRIDSLGKAMGLALLRLDLP